MQTEVLDTGIRFFGYKILLEKTKDAVLDAALKRVFVKDFYKSGPLNMSDPDIQLVVGQSQTRNRKSKTIEAGQQLLFK